jgi:YihY family inner membrane protein
MAEIYVKEHVTRSSAALAYFLTISIFPLLICVSALLGSLKLDQESLFAIFEEIIPAQALSVIGDFFEYVSRNQSAVMLIVGLGVMMTSSAAAFRTIMNIMGDIHGKKRFKGLWGELFNFVLSLCFLAVIYLSGLVVLTGEWFLQFLERNLGLGNILSVWQWVRFVLLFLTMFAVILGIYLASAPKAAKKTRRLPGASIAAALLVLVSVVFSHLISASTKYAVVYGSLASIIILMTWLYTCGIILIMGNVFNICLAREFSHGESN